MLYFISTWEMSKYIETKLETSCFYLILSIFSKIKRSLELVSLPHFLHNFWRKMFLPLHYINWRSFNVWLLYFVRYWAICLLQLFVNQVLTSWILKLALHFLTRRNKQQAISVLQLLIFIQFSNTAFNYNHFLSLVAVYQKI